MAKNKISRAEREAAQQALLLELNKAQAELTTRNTGKSKKQSQPSGKGGEKPGAEVAALAGKAAVVHEFSKGDLLDAIEAGNVDKVKMLLESSGHNSAAFLNSDQTAKVSIKETIRGLKDIDDISTAVSIARLLYTHGLNWEPTGDPVTTRLLAIKGQNCGIPDVQIENAHMLAGAIRHGNSFQDVLVRMTAIRARDTRSIESARAYASLTMAALEKKQLPADSTDTLTFLDTALAQLGNPNILSPDDRNILDVSERAFLGTQIAFQILDDQVPLFDESKSTRRAAIPQHKRMDAFAQDLRVTAEKMWALSCVISSGSHREEALRTVLHELGGKLRREEITLENQDLNGRNPQDESIQLLLSSFRLLSRAMKRYQIEPVTINSALGTINRISLPMDKNTCSLVEKIIKQAVDNPDIKAGLLPESLNVYVTHLLRIGTEDTLSSSIVIASRLAEPEEGKIYLSPDILNDIHTKTANITLRSDLQGKRDLLPKIIEGAKIAYQNEAKPGLRLPEATAPTQTKPNGTDEKKRLRDSLGK